MRCCLSGVSLALAVRAVFIKLEKYVMSPPLGLTIAMSEVGN